MKKILVFCVFILGVLLCIEAGNLELFDKTPSHYDVDANGEIILKLKKADWVYRCIDCHQDFKTRTDAREMTSEHRELYYDHIKGERWCFFCHYEDLEKRDRIKLPGGIYRGAADMVKLCSQCHGEKNREWEIGIHGKTTGSWLTYGDLKQQRKSCEQCHSPHHPRSFKIIPLPGPRLRFDKPKESKNHE